MKKILATTGQVLHTKVYKETDAQGTVQVCQLRCYFAFDPTDTKCFRTQEEWARYLNEIMGEYIEGPPAFIQMQPCVGASKADSMVSLGVAK